MKRSPYYQLKYIAGIPYLVAFGQAAADFGQDLRLNETGAFLWSELENADSEAELAARCAGHFNCNPEDMPALEANVRHFIDTLSEQGIIVSGQAKCEKACPLYAVLKIAGLFCKLYGLKDAFEDSLLAFSTFDKPEAAFSQNIYIRPYSAGYEKNGRLLFHNSYLSVLEGSSGYFLLFPSLPHIREAHISFDGKEASIFCTADASEERRREIFLVIRTLFLYFAGTHGMLALHSASVLYKDRLWLFSAASGIGKSTHVSLWHELLNVPVINGDLNLIALKDGIPVVHGIPWCGTSGIFSTETYPLGGIILLMRGAHNEVITLTKDEQLLFLLHRSISPAWNGSMQGLSLGLLENIADEIFIRRFACTPTEAAVNTIKTSIDGHVRKDFYSE